jgi:hypothetical protein
MFNININNNKNYKRIAKKIILFNLTYKHKLLAHVSTLSAIVLFQFPYK